MEKLVNFNATFPITPVCPQPADNSIWSLFLEVRLKIKSTVPLSGFGSGWMSMLSGSKWPVCAISRAERIKSSLEKSSPGAHVQFAADHFFVQTVVSIDDNAVDCGLGTFGDAHFERDGIAFDFRFDWDELEEQVAVVHIQVGHGVVVFQRALVQERLVVDIACLHAEDGIKCGRGVHGVSGPSDVGNEVLLSFFHGDEHVDKFVVVGSDAVAYDSSIAIAQFVVFFLIIKLRSFS